MQVAPLPRSPRVGKAAVSFGAALAYVRPPGTAEKAGVESGPVSSSGRGQDADDTFSGAVSS